MQTGATTWTNTYNSDGLRTGRTDGTTTYTYIYENGKLSAVKRNDLNMWITYDDHGPVTIQYGVGVFHYVTNPQGDVVAIVASDGSKLVEYTYDAWGKVTSITGDFAYNLGIHNPILYRGYVYDHETGLYYCQSRYYDPEIGRFINADGLVTTGQGFVGNNMFAYCGNNPVNYTDPSGAAYQGIYQQINYNEHDHTYGGLRENFYAIRHNKLTTTMNQLEEDLSQMWESFLTAPLWDTFGGRVIKESIIGGVVGAASGATTGFVSSLFGAPFTAGASTAATTGIMAVIGFVGGAVTGAVDTVIREIWNTDD